MQKSIVNNDEGEAQTRKKPVSLPVKSRQLAHPIFQTRGKVQILAKFSYILLNLSGAKHRLSIL
jgi:hypothetical protein